MKRQQWLTAVLLAVLLILAVAVYLVEFRGEEEEPSLPRLLEVPASRIQWLLVRSGEGTFRFERDETNTWWMTEPYAGPVEQRLVENAARYLAGLESFRHFAPEEVDLEAFGLLTPTAVIEIGTMAGERHTLEVGRASPRQRTGYVRLDGEAYLVSWDLVSEILRITTMPPLPEGVTPPGRGKRPALALLTWHQAYRIPSTG